MKRLPSDLPLSREAQAALLARLPEAEWEYDEDADEMEVRLPSAAGREGYYALLRDDLYVRLDAETGEPLGVMIPSYQLWLGRHIAMPAARGASPTVPAGAGDPVRWIAEQDQAAPQALARELAGAAS